MPLAFEEIIGIFFHLSINNILFLEFVCFKITKTKICSIRSGDARSKFSEFFAHVNEVFADENLIPDHVCCWRASKNKIELESFPCRACELCVYASRVIHFQRLHV